MSDNHIILLPRANYYKWVRAAQKYAMAFGVNITPDPPKIGGRDVVTIANVPGGYPEEGDIVEWVKTNFPNVRIDAIDVDTPNELMEAFDSRVENRQRFSAKGIADPAGAVLPKYPTDRLYLFWPTDYPSILQEFGANPEIYGKFGLPGHEGVDIRAPLNTNVYACAEGEVYLIETDPDKHAYGKHIRIHHEQGYRTIYGHLNEILVEVGDKVKTKQLIGKADSTGNSSGSHLHLTLKMDRATVEEKTDYPGDILDPTPFLVLPQHEREVLEALGMEPPNPAEREYGWVKPCAVGLNIRPDGAMQEVDFNVISTAQLEAVKVFENTNKTTISRIRQILPGIFIMARLTFKLNQQKRTPDESVEMVKKTLDRLYAQDVRYFEIHQSPNLQMYGWGLCWNSGEDFAGWWLGVVKQLQDQYPDAKFGFPGVSPGGHISGQRFDAKVFLDQADDALQAADWIGVNCYWLSEAEMNWKENGEFYKYFRERFPNKLLFITEFGNINTYTNPYVKGLEYVKYYHKLRKEEGIGAAFAQVLSAASGFNSLAWRSEDGKINEIPYQVGMRMF